MISAATTEEAVDTAQDILVPVLAVAGSVVVALLLAVLIGVLVRSLAKKSFVAADLARRAKRPLRAVLIVIAVWVALRVSVPDATWETSWMGAIGHVLLIALIGTATWLVGTLAFVVEDAALSRYRVDVKDNRHARRVRTQVQLLRRITVAVLVVVAVAAVLLTFPGVSAFGASLLASAGVLSIVAGLAAQSSLANVFAGLQLAFTDAIRVDDVVIADDEWGRIEEITLTYVVVHVWDDRRLILPSTYFTQTPFENWTRRAADLLGTVELDVDWQVPVDELRAELNRLLQETDLWDHRVGILQVTDAVNGWVRLRALASAVDAPTLFDLRCYLREGLVTYLQASAPQGLPRTRIETTKGAPLPVAEATPARRPRPATGSHAVVEPRPETGQLDARLFTGSVEAMQRAGSFAGPGEDVIAEREEHAAESRHEDPETPVPGRSSGGRRGADDAGPGTAAVPVAGTRGAAAASGATGAATPAADAAPGAADAAPGAAGTGTATTGTTAVPATQEPRGPRAVPPLVPGPGATGPVGGADPADGVQPVASVQPVANVQPGAGAAPGADVQPGADAEPGTMVLPAFADATATFPVTTEPPVPGAGPQAAGPSTAGPQAAGPSTAETQAQPEVADDEQPAPPTRRSVRSAPVDPRTRRD